LITSANGFGAPGAAAAGLPGGRAVVVDVAAGAPATVALVADDAGAPTGVLEEGVVVAAVVAGGVTVAQDESITATAMNNVERAVRESTTMYNSKNQGQLMSLSRIATGVKGPNMS
jgi:hypothetical protein